MKRRDAIYAQHIRPMAPIPTGIAPNLSKIQRYSAILFDVYGTLLISGAGEIGFNQESSDGEDGVLHLLRRYGINRNPQCLALARNLAIERSHAVARGKGIDYPEVDIRQVWQQVLAVDDICGLEDFALEHELIVNPVYLMPGVEVLLTACKTRKVPMGIISNAQFYTLDVLERFFGTTLEMAGFDQRLLFFSWREGHAKPSTIMFDRAKAVLSGMGIPAETVLFVGNDMRNDIWPAKAVGFKSALFAGDRRSLRQRQSDDRCKGVAPDLIVNDLRQLIPGIGKA